MTDPARLNPLVTAGLMLAVCASAILMAIHGRTSGRREPIKGILYSSAQQTGASPNAATDDWAARAAPAAYPEVELALEPAARAALPKGDTFVVHLVVPNPGAPTLTLAPRLPAPPARARAAKPSRSKTIMPPPEPIAAAAPIISTPTPVAAPVVPPPTPPAPPPPPKPTQPVTFTEFDEALRNSATTEGLNVRLRRGGVVFRVTHVGRIGDEGAVRFAIANEEASDFFLSIVNVTAGASPIHSETAGPLVCRGGGPEVYGVVHFAFQDAKGKRLAVELIQSGGDRRHFQLEIPYQF